MKVIVWRDSVLAPSETFIAAQAASLRFWKASLGGLTAHESSPTQDYTSLYGTGAWEQILYLLARATRIYPRVHRWVKDERAAVIHAHFAPSGWTIGRAARKAKVPLVVTLHGYDVTAWPCQPGLKGFAARWRLRRVFREATTLLAVSEHIRSQALRWGAPADKVVVHYTGVPVDKDTPIQKPAERDILFVGRLVEKKGIQDLVESMSLNGGVGYGLAIAGDGPLREQLQTSVELHGSNVEFLGPQRPENIRHLMSSSRLLVAPSKTAQNGDTEGLPTVILEAMSQAIPVIATRHAGIPEAITDGQTGLLVDEGDQMALQSAIRMLLEDPELAREMGRNGHKRVRDEFDIDVRSGELESIYSRGIADHPDVMRPTAGQEEPDAFPDPRP